MEESLGMTKTQAKSLMKYISDNMKIPVLGAGGGFAPLGCINAYMGTVAPQGWLICDGQTVNIADYTELATHFASHFGSANFFGGDGTTTFAVPDLRGEFLRGSGTNSHENQGNGAEVGVHQDATNLPYGEIKANDNKQLQFLTNSAINYDQFVANPDSSFNLDTSGTLQYIQYAKDGSGTTSSATYRKTIRPTNTSVTYIIKATVSGNPEGHVYSTEEQIVGTDIDGSVVYEKTFIIDSGITSNESIFLLDGINGIVDYNIMHYISAWNAWIGNYMETTEKWIQSNCFITTTNPYQLRVVPRFALTVEIDKLRVTIRYTKTS